MKVVSFEGPRKMSVLDRPKPTLKYENDAILRVTTSGICGSDLHMYDGRTELSQGAVVGHEIMGVIEETGNAVASLKKGDRVVLPFNIACGYCVNCHRGYTNACLTMNPEGVSAGYGYAGMGPYQGGPAEYVLVPHADFNCLKVPGTPVINGKMISFSLPMSFRPHITQQSWPALLRARVLQFPARGPWVYFLRTALF